jgi:hypothetical protein
VSQVDPRFHTRHRARGGEIRQAVEVENLWIIGLVAVLGLMLWAALRIEPHWSTKDGRRFVCHAQELADGEPLSRNQEARIVVLPDGTLHVTRKRTLGRHSTATWTLIGKSPSPPKRVEIYVAQQRSDGSLIPAQLAMRIPPKSRCVKVLDEILAARLSPRSSPRAPGTTSPADRPDPG